jgi:hypothetical protein
MKITLYTCQSGVNLNNEYSNRFHASSQPNHTEDIKYKFVIDGNSSIVELSPCGFFTHYVEPGEYKFEEVSE